MGESLDGIVPPHGFVIAAACDFSRKARDAFREEMVARGVREFYLWGKADLEDMLFQAKNDPILFAYFGISLQPRRRALRTQLRSLIAAKKQVHALFKTAYENHDEPVCLLRDPADDRYPSNDAIDQRWRLCRVAGEDTPDGFMVVWKEHPAWISDDGAHWDVIESVDFVPVHARLRMESGRYDSNRRAEEDPAVVAGREFWNEYVNDSQRAMLRRFRVVPWDRILALDPHGDDSYPIPQVLLDSDADGSPYTDGVWSQLRRSGSGFGPSGPRPTEETRVKFFPVPIPEALFPPPDHIVRTLATKPPPLPDDIRREVGEVIVGMKSRAAARTAHGSPVPLGQSSAEQELKFSEWVTGVAAPTLSSFAAELRAAGHQAWILPREALDTSQEHAPAHIELQIRLHDLNAHNLIYHRRGHVTYTVQHNGRVKMDLSPSAQESPNAYGVSRPATPEASTLDSLTADRVHSDVLAVLKRLSSERWP